MKKFIRITFGFVMPLLVCGVSLVFITYTHRESLAVLASTGPYLALAGFAVYGSFTIAYLHDAFSRMHFQEACAKEYRQLSVGMSFGLMLATNQLLRIHNLSTNWLVVILVFSLITMPLSARYLLKPYLRFWQLPN